MPVQTRHTLVTLPRGLQQFPLLEGRLGHHSWSRAHRQRLLKLGALLIHPRNRLLKPQSRLSHLKRSGVPFRLELATRLLVWPPDQFLSF